MAGLLKAIESPQDLKRLSNQEMEELAVEIRRFLLETVSQTGGHLAPNLGVVELTLALHSVFDSPYDQIIWDVGHQSYVHKILTGRMNAFHTLRQYKGISGFPKPEESIHDVFATGHSSTSISAAVGLAKARDLLGEANDVVAVIGDGSMTGGMAFEALNHLGHLQTDLIIVLNDNEMSISKNVGALSRYLTRLRVNPRLRKLKSEVQELLQKIPRVGQATVRYLEKLEDSLSYLVIPGMLFEELGITYLGPIDGHNLVNLKQGLNDAKNHGGPVLVHVLTTKGKGYMLAENNPQKFHSTGSFNVKSGQKNDPSESYSFTEIYGKTIVDLAKNNDKIIAITAAMTDGTGLLQFAKEFPDRFIDVGIAEEHAVTMAAGLATKGFHPAVTVYSTFLQRAYDQILHDVCLQKLPVTLMMDRAGLVGSDGPTHHGVFDLSYLRQMPNMVVMAPYNEIEFANMIYTAFDHPGPVAIRYPKREGLDEPKGNYQKMAIGKGQILCSGEEVAIIAIGAMVGHAVTAAGMLKDFGINCTVMNARFVKPLDEQLLLQLARTHHYLITVEENIIAGGFGSAIAELFARENISDVHLKILGIPDEFVPHGSNEILFKNYGLDPEGICKTVRELKIPMIGLRARK